MSRERVGRLLTRLGALHPKKIDLSLGRIERLLKALGNPHRRLPPVIHVAGTNAKGSVIAFMRATGEAGGLGVHAYTSPHLVRFAERICLGRRGARAQMIDDDALSAALETCEAANDGAAITFFEITTAAAFLAFAERADDADMLLLETGLGGRLDATNMVAPALCVITPIALDHQSFLGETLAEIAGEKAGIIKTGVPVICAAQEAEALRVIEAAAQSRGAPFLCAGRDWHVRREGAGFAYEDATGRLELPLPALEGAHQMENAGVALSALRRFGNAATGAAACAQAMRDVVWPGRLERIDLPDAPEGAEVWLDGGHNPAAAATLARFCRARGEKDNRALYLICAMGADKNAGGFLAPFRELAARVLCLPLADEAHIAPELLSAEAQKAGLRAEACDTMQAALCAIAEDAARARILICGSLYLVGELRAACLAR